MRASDRDRDQTAERLRHAAGEGRLAPEELEQRLRAAFAARTYGELDALVGDLPSPQAPTDPRRATLTRLRPVLPWLVGLAALLLILMVMAMGVAMREHASAAAPFPPAQTAGPSASP
ncbi:MAG TPA: DUF1707 domain-containing protein [Solirubrobacteraceae bacterium]|nr:DUF1707 domain-containing protein [Solirubrobacteraceae bacterium]